MTHKEKIDEIIENTKEIRYDLLEHCVKISPPGMKLEFGVAHGGTINRIAALSKSEPVYGFDTFTGLPEAWHGMPVGAFDQGGKFPGVKENVQLFKGLFQETLDDFLESHTDLVGFCHIDSDLYSSCAFVLDKLKNRFFDGTIIVLDELAHYPDYLDHEYKAFLEFLDYSGFDFEFLGRGSTESFAFRLKKQ